MYQTFHIIARALCLVFYYAFRYTIIKSKMSQEVLMELLLTSQEECHRIEVYNEYLKKIPELLKQLETVEKMYQKAILEEAMLKDKDRSDHSVLLYSDRLNHIKQQCEERSADIRQQCHLIFELKAQIEAESSALDALINFS